MPHWGGFSVFSGTTGGGSGKAPARATPVTASSGTAAGGTGDKLGSFTAGPSPQSYFQSGSSGCFRSQRGRRLWTTGTSSKLYAGGGEVVAHSSVQASQGLSPAGGPCRRDQNTLYTKMA